MKNKKTSIVGLSATLSFAFAAAVVATIASIVFLYSMTGVDVSSVDKKIRSKGMDAMKSKAPEISITVFPIDMAGKGFKNVAEVAALMLEKSGVKKIEVSGAELLVRPEDDLSALCDSFGSFVLNQQINTDYALFGQYIGSQDSGVKAVRGIVVDSTGNCIWAESQTSEDELFKKIAPKDPMLCTYLLVRSISDMLGLPDPDRDDAPRGEWAAYWDKQSGRQQSGEPASMEARQKVFRKGFVKSTVTIYPVLLRDSVSKDNAEHLSTLLGEKKLCQAKVAAEELLIAVEPATNEQKMLWELANKFKDHAKENPVTSDYSLYAQYFMSPRNGRIMAVHFIVCDRYGDWVIVDFQNDHHEDFNAVAPASASDCDKLVIRRLEGYLQRR